MGAVDTIGTAADQWSWYVWHITWQASLLAALIVLVAHVGRRRSPRLAYGLLVLALVKFAAFPTLSMWTGLFSHLGPAVTATARLAGPPWLKWLMLIHLAGAVVVAGRVVFQMVHLARLVRGAEAITSGPVYRHLSYMARKIGLHRSVRLLACREGTSPMAFGVVTPSVIVPASMLTDLPPRQVATVLAHELAHHRRGDLWINWFQIVLTALWWFNPLIWLLNRALRKMREDCCDDLLLREELATDDGYCETLLLVAAQMSRSRLPRGIPRFAERLHPLGRRMIRIMDPDIHRRSPLSILRSPALILLAVLLLPGLRVHSLLAPIPTRPTPPAALAATPDVGRTVIVPRRSARRSFDRVAVDVPRGVGDVGRHRAGPLGPLQLTNLPGDVAAAPAPPPMAAPAASAPARRIRSMAAAPAAGPIGWHHVATMQLTQQFGDLGTPAPVSRTTAGQRAAELIDVVADSRPEPLAPKIDAPDAPPPIDQADLAALATVEIPGLPVDPGGIDEPLIPAGSATVAMPGISPFDGVVLASATVETPPAWVYLRNLSPADPAEPTTLVLLGLGAAIVGRRRRVGRA